MTNALSIGGCEQEAEEKANVGSAQRLRDAIGENTTGDQRYPYLIVRLKPTAAHIGVGENTNSSQDSGRTERVSREPILRLMHSLR